MKDKIKKINPGLLFISPWLIGFILLVVWPLIQSFYFSLNTIRLRPTGRVYIFVGLNNYRDVWLKDMFFVQELIQFLISSILRVPVIVVFSLIIALLLNQDLKYKGLLRVIFFMPVIISSGPVMNQLIQEGATSIPIVDINNVNNIISSILPTWLANPFMSLFSEIIVVLWYSGVQILIFIAALQKIDRSLYEAAKMDGASKWESFWKITLPTLRPMILLNAIYTLIVLSNSGQNNIINLIYNNMFSATRGYGFASAMAWMYSIIILLMIGITYLLLRESPGYTTNNKSKKKRKFTRFKFFKRKEA
ncbi:MAG: sugar ABC transporter permease [Bacteroidales bacterium]|nr:sugar ABC transporter permease [Bacteroidales bacterium]